MEFLKQVLFVSRVMGSTEKRLKYAEFLNIFKIVRSQFIKIL